MVRLPQRSDWLAWFAKHHIKVGIHYETPVHLMPAYLRFGQGPGSLPNTEAACRSVISLPMLPELRACEINRVCDAIMIGLSDPSMNLPNETTVCNAG